MFIDIADTGDYGKLIVEGSAATDETFEAWEKIIEESSKVNGNNGYRSYFDNIKHYNKLLRDFNLIKSALSILYFEVDTDLINFLKTKGYNINTSGRMAYENSLNASMLKSNNLITRIEMRYKEIIKATEQSKGSNQSASFESMMANLNYSLNLVETDNITLARYNEYMKIIRLKNKESQNSKSKR